MRIIICDDDPVFLDEMSERIQTYFEKQGSDVTIKTVMDGNELLRMLGNYPADAVFLDIDMPGINGFETAGAVKKQYPDCILVFCSCHNELVYDSFEYEPFWFLCKSNAEEKTGIFRALPEYDTALMENRKNKVTMELARRILKEAEPVLRALPTWENESLYACMLGLSDTLGCKSGAVLWCMRIAVAGQAVTPGGATEIMAVIGREESLRRLATSLAKLGE